MWQVIAAVLASASPQASQPVTVKGTAFGPRQRLVCEWFTNFENSRFEQCHILGGTAPLLDEGASIECAGQSCEELDAAARKAVQWKKPEPVWGTFTVEILGRVSTERHRKRYLGDATRTVLIENLVSIRKR
ncbi:hypothetical protein GCM10008023_41840 [Sphingomonas glacialis]|uniref:DUF2147 domain-containing protein n=1 Tax=Sphingomonas glacialis TaxID=658225 RepID=A0ABQ3LX01_9SPHN|nr:hypothetical protein GCM10008023_41840 [Sphingomonas glacialis]